jgi:hypothetical protein
MLVEFVKKKVARNGRPNIHKTRVCIQCRSGIQKYFEQQKISFGSYRFYVLILDNYIIRDSFVINRSDQEFDGEYGNAVAKTKTGELHTLQVIQLVFLGKISMFGVLWVCYFQCVNV